jgi:NADPH-dependent 2,4-dienoyl-CoA reductase/sulfur reductase-like enzyme
LPKPRRIAVIGASLTGLNAVQAAREAGYDGQLILIGDEPHPPCDRPPLSKDWLRGDAKIDPPIMCGAEELRRDLDVDLRLGAAAEALDPRARVVRVGGEDVEFDAVLVTTGLRARTLRNMPQLAGVHTIRRLADAEALRASLDGARDVVVIGGGFIGFETASVARERGQNVTIVEAHSTPLARAAVGETAGAALAERLRRHGVHIETDAHVEALEGETCVTGVRLADGRRLAADVVIVSVGADPATVWLQGSGLSLDGGVVCDARLNAGFDGVWAAGDVASWPNPLSGRLAGIEHWTNAVDQGRHAMLNALDPSLASPYRAVPYFWSDWGDDALQFAGVVEGSPEIVAGDWGAGSFVALYLDGAAFHGVLTLNRRADVMKYRALLDRGATAADALAFAASRADKRSLGGRDG